MKSAVAWQSFKTFNLIILFWKVKMILYLDLKLNQRLKSNDEEAKEEKQGKMKVEEAKDLERKGAK